MRFNAEIADISYEKKHFVEMKKKESKYLLTYDQINHTEASREVNINNKYRKKAVWEYILIIKFPSNDNWLLYLSGTCYTKQIACFAKTNRLRQGQCSFELLKD